MVKSYSSDNVGSAQRGTSVLLATATYSKSRGIYIGVTQDLDLCFDGTNWILYKAMQAGMVYPFQVVGARKNSGSAAPDAGDVVLLY